MLLRLPTAVLLLWDELAPRAIAAIRDTRREVPHDVPLISFNNDELCTLIPPRISRPSGRTAKRWEKPCPAAGGTHQLQYTHSIPNADPQPFHQSCHHNFTYKIGESDAKEIYFFELLS